MGYVQVGIQPRLRIPVDLSLHRPSLSLLINRRLRLLHFRGFVSGCYGYGIIVSSLTFFLHDKVFPYPIYSIY